jgi:hypothetical protein
MIEPQYQPLIGVPLAWTSGTNGVVTGEPVMAVLRTERTWKRTKASFAARLCC